MSNLTDRDKAMLELAGAQFKYPGARDAAMRERFDLSPTSFWVHVGQLIHDPAAVAWNPMLTGRLRRMQEKRRAARTVRGSGRCGRSPTQQP